MRAETAARYLDEKSVEAFRRGVGTIYPKPCKLAGKGDRWLKDDLDRAIDRMAGPSETIRDIADPKGDLHAKGQDYTPRGKIDSNRTSARLPDRKSAQRPRTRSDSWSLAPMKQLSEAASFHHWALKHRCGLALSNPSSWS
jgi:hypothetical protein